MIGPFERRRSPRQKIALPIHFLNPDFGRGRPILEATTTNVSAGGFYVQCSPSEPLDVGIAVAVRILVPDARIDRYSYVKFNLRGTGRVVRVEPRGNVDVPLAGVAVAFDRHLEFENFTIL